MNYLIFLGTARDSTPPAPPRLGLRVARACSHHLARFQPDHTGEIIDPLELETGPVFKPHFAYPRSQAPAQLEDLARKIEAADAYIMVSPEYNHSLSPALAHLLNHFGSSLFAFKPSAIVTYSAGQWGGARAAVALRTFLSELGCLPVSAMIQVPHARDLLCEDGSLAENENAEGWDEYFGRTLLQLEWWASAARMHREQQDPHQQTRPFNQDPSQRNAPDT